MPLTHRSIGVHISCDGLELERYKREAVDDATVQCYIPSEAGKDITVNVQDQGTSLSKVVFVYLDGQLARLMWMETGSLKISDVYTSPTTAHNIQFANLELQGEDEINPSRVSSLEKLGTISIICRRASRDLTKPSEVYAGCPVPDIGPIPERSKKLGCHRTTLTAERTVLPLTTGYPIYLDTLDQPYARFIFRYQPAGLLQANGIMPRKTMPETRNEPQQSAGAGSSNSQRAKRPLPLAHQAAERAPKRRALMQASTVGSSACRLLTNFYLQVNSSSSRTRERSSSSQGVKQENATSDPAQAEAIRTLQESIQAARDTMLAAQAQLDRLENRQVKTERAPSPIRVGATHGEIIDLTLDD